MNCTRTSARRELPPPPPPGKTDRPATSPPAARTSRGSGIYRNHVGGVIRPGLGEVEAEGHLSGACDRLGQSLKEGCFTGTESGAMHFVEHSQQAPSGPGMRREARAVHCAPSAPSIGCFPGSGRSGQSGGWGQIVKELDCTRGHLHCRPQGVGGPSVFTQEQVLSLRKLMPREACRVGCTVTGEIGAQGS